MAASTTLEASDFYIICECCGETREGFFTDLCDPVMKPRGPVYGIPYPEWRALDESVRAQYLREQSPLAGLLFAA